MRLMKSMRSCAAPPATSSSETPHVLSIAELRPISTACWQWKTALGGTERSPSHSLRRRLTQTNSTLASCKKRADSCLSTIRVGPSCAACLVGPIQPWESAMPRDSSRSATSGIRGCSLRFTPASLSCFCCWISRSNSSNQELCPPSAGWYVRPVSANAPSLALAPLPPPLAAVPRSSLSSQESSPTFSPEIFFLYQCSCILSMWKIRLARGVSPTLSGCQVLNNRLMTAL
mmetsp:Transcript_33786/g.95814  ORF Transcript_33786/g.95814 Transcript_33786/m.95814 type:complete len:231 (-) Transcript_33786:469-1161(-)